MGVGSRLLVSTRRFPKTPMCEMSNEYDSHAFFLHKHDYFPDRGYWYNKKCMSNQETKEWQYHNDKLQKAYHDYCRASGDGEKSHALGLIQYELGWAPFADYCSECSSTPFGIVKYGLDYMTERCIENIDRIAKGEKIL